MSWPLALALLPPSTEDLPLDEAWGYLGSQGPLPRHHLKREGLTKVTFNSEFGTIWLTIQYGGMRIYSTRKICWRERVFDFINIRFKFIDFQLQIWNWNSLKVRQCTIFCFIYTVDECSRVPHLGSSRDALYALGSLLSQLLCQVCFLLWRLIRHVGPINTQNGSLMVCGIKENHSIFQLE